jgi:CheY-like chemotaxis protein/anti-sigma regulatory factor (Ser/Thr protein kinase)
MGTILVIEDDDTVRENISEILELNGFQSYAAANGRIGLEMALEVLPDLIICDMMMPEMNGMEVLRALREEKNLSHIPFIFLTARVEKKDFRAAMKTGADDYLTKPFDLHELLDSIQSKLNRSRNLQDHIQARTEELKRQIKLTESHELNTPVFGILGSIKVLKEFFNDLNEEEKLELISAAYRSALRLETTLRQESLYGKIIYLEQSEEARERFIEGVTPDPIGIIADISQSLLEFYDRPSHLLNLGIERVPFPMSPDNFKAIVSELLSNALKFSSANSPIYLNLKNGNDQVNLEFGDQGIGVDISLLEKIYPFRQLNKEKREQQGKGLGLFIVKKIVDFHHGTLQFQNNAGGGLIVKISIPKNKKP